MPGFDPTTLPEFGIDTDEVQGEVHPQKVHRHYNTELLQYQDGWDVQLFPLSFEQKIEANKLYGESCHGIANSQESTRNSLGVPVRSAKMTVKEIISKPFLRGLHGGAAPEKGQRLLCCDGLVIKGIQVSVSVLGMYNSTYCPNGMSPAGSPPFAQGTILSGGLFLKPAVASTTGLSDLLTVGIPFTTDVGELGAAIDPIVRSFRVIRQAGDWVTFQADFEAIIGNNEDWTDATIHLLEPKLLLSSVITSLSAYYSLERTVELSVDKEARLTEVATVFPDADYPDGF
ncbi:MAG: hypothetical protein JW941_00410 [Candidatus Coatesbacteria bacterium]|nr:hypothetical protein [Candidatus Coatesbacteria bacterium]